MGTERLDDDALLDSVQRETFAYFLHLANPVNGLVADCTRPGWPCSIAATGLAPASYPVGVERGWMKREDALARTRNALEFFAASEQGEAPGATGLRGFHYHFLDLASGRRTWDSEVSTSVRSTTSRTAEARRSRRFRSVVQSALSGRAWKAARLAQRVELRDQPGADRADDRELPQRHALAADARCPPLVEGLRRAGFSGGWLR